MARYLIEVPDLTVVTNSLPVVAALVDAPSVDVVMVGGALRRSINAFVGPLTDEYSLTSDWDNQWLTGGLEPDVIAEAHLDAPSILAGIKRFATDRDQRIARQRSLLGS